MAYQNPAEFDRALKRAVRDAGGDLGTGYRQALRDRFALRQGIAVTFDQACSTASALFNPALNEDAYDAWHPSEGRWR